jgi:lipopolysaccharide biosynthesis glycosyltransferase
MTESNSDNLVYYAIGGDPGYSKMLQYSIETLMDSEENKKIKVVVICEKEYSFNLKNINVELLIVKKNKINHSKKLEIFSYKKINQYKKVMYLDCDITIRGSLIPLFEQIKDDGKIQVVPERSRIHKSRFFECLDEPYDMATLQFFTDKGILPFNSGQFGFWVSETMRNHFKKIIERSKSYDPKKHFYEQSFMNNYFNRINLVGYEIEKFVQIFSSKMYNREKTVNHFCGATTPWKTKLKMMKTLHGVT